MNWIQVENFGIFRLSYGFFFFLLSILNRRHKLYSHLFYFTLFHKLFYLYIPNINRSYFTLQFELDFENISFFVLTESLEKQEFFVQFQIIRDKVIYPSFCKKIRMEC